jgi:3D (Asp-Asp-Asp) domain-containing protein
MKNTIKILFAGIVIVAMLSTSVSMSALEHNKVLSLQKQCEELTLDLGDANQDLIRLQDELQLKQEENTSLSDFISENDEKYKKIEEVEKQNKELKEQNDVLSIYHSASKIISRGGSGITDTRLNTKKIKVEVSMFTSYDAGVDDTTAMGTKVGWGVVAVPKEIPLGTELLIPGVDSKQVFKAEDHGGYIKKVGNVYRIDVWTDSLDKAFKFGRKVMDAYIVMKE